MIIRFINPFRFGNFKEWDCIIVDDNGNIIFRVCTQFDSADEDSTIESVGMEIFNSQGYDPLLTLNSITIDKPDSWQYTNQ